MKAYSSRLILISCAILIISAGFFAAGIALVNLFGLDDLLVSARNWKGWVIVLIALATIIVSLSAGISLLVLSKRIAEDRRMKPL